MPNLPPRYNVLGVGISALKFEQARDLVISARGARKLGYVCFATAHSLSIARADAALREIYNRSWLTTPDGMPVVWLGPAGTERVYGPDLMLAVCDAGRAVGLRHYFYGGKPGVVEALKQRLEERYPGIEIVGHHTPSFRDPSEAEMVALCDDVARVRPDLIWVGLGTPKQDRFMEAAAGRFDTALLLGVGAAFDFHSGRVRQAPRWIRQSGFEWLFRLAMEPGRLGSRYFLYNPLFILHVTAQKSGLRKYSLEPTGRL